MKSLLATFLNLPFIFILLSFTCINSNSDAYGSSLNKVGDKCTESKSNTNKSANQKNNKNNTQNRNKNFNSNQSNTNNMNNLNSNSSNNRKCKAIAVRKEIRALTDQELDAFFNAILKLSEGKHPNTWDKLSLMHIENGKEIHGNSMFFPWHRYFVHHFQQEIYKINPNVTIPYWDWSIDAQAPDLSPIFSDKMFGGNGDKNKNNCITTGRFKNLEVYAHINGSFPRCLKRDFNEGNNRITPFAIYERLVDLIKINSNFDDFRPIIETGPHGAVHDGIGGRLGDMEYYHSPNDPLFYMHHAFVDKIWLDYQKSWPNLKQFGVQSESTLMVNYKVPVKSVFDTTSYPLCYTYDNSDLEIKNSNSNSNNNNNNSQLNKRGAYPVSKAPSLINLNTNTNPTYNKFNDLLSNTNNSTKNLTPSQLYDKIYDACPSDICPKLISRQNQTEKLRLMVPISKQFALMNSQDIRFMWSQHSKYSNFVNKLNSMPDFESKYCLKNLFRKYGSNH